jgi:hypothetical protein
MTYREYLKAQAENLQPKNPVIPDGKLSIGAAEELRSIPLNTLQRFPSRSPVQPNVKTADDTNYLDTGSMFTLKDFPQTGYVGEVL